MSTAKVNPIPAGSRFIPYLSVRRAAKAIEFYKNALGAVQTERLDMPDGRVAHAELTIGPVQIMLADEMPEFKNRSPESLGDTPVCFCLYVENVDGAAERAVAAGAKLLRPIKDEFYGDRVALIQDPYGYKWSLASRVEEVSPQELRERFAKMSPC